MRKMRERAFYIWLRYKYPDLKLTEAQERIIHNIMEIEKDSEYLFLLFLLRLFYKEFPEPKVVFEQIGLR